MDRSENNLYEFGTFHLDTAERLLLRNSLPVPLAPKVFDTLVVLVQHGGHLLTKDELMQKVWPDSFVEEVNLTVNISALRKALGDDQNGQRYIDTVPKQGYRFVAPVRELANNGAELEMEKHITERNGAEEEESGVLGEYVEAEQSADEKALAAVLLVDTDTTWRLRPVTLAACVSLIVLGAAVSYFWILNKPNPTGPLAVRSIAVLPFKPLVAERRDEALELGMAETLINKLSRIRQVHVRPINAVRKYSALEQDPITAGRELGVDYVLVGNLQMEGDKARATVMLWSVKDGSTVWADNFDEPFITIFQLQTAVAQQVAGKLTLQLMGEEKQQLAKHDTENTDAYRLYIEGKYYFLKLTKEGFEKSIEHYEQAIKIDPAYALAYAGLARTYIFMGGVGLLPPNEALQKGEMAAQQAVRLDDGLAEAHLALAEVKFADWDWAGANHEYQRAIKLDPGSADIHGRYSFYLGRMGRIDEAQAESYRALQIDPTSASRYGGLARSLAASGQYDQAIEQYLKAIAMQPDHAPFYSNLGWTYVAARRYVEAIAALQKARELDNFPERRGRFAFLAYAYAVSGRKDEALRMLAELKKMAKQRYIPPYNFAIIYHGLGDKDQTFAYLEKAYAERFPALADIKDWDKNDPFRDDPRYADLLRRMNLAP